MPEWQTCDAVGMTGLRTDPQLATQLQPATPEFRACNAVDMAGLRTDRQLTRQLQLVL